MIGEKVKAPLVVTIAEQSKVKTDCTQAQYEIDQNESIFKIRRVNEEDSLKIKLKISFTPEQKEPPPRRVSERKRIKSTYYDASFDVLEIKKTVSEKKIPNKKTEKSKTPKSEPIVEVKEKIDSIIQAKKPRAPKKKKTDISTKIVIPQSLIIAKPVETISNINNINNDKISESTATSPKIQKEEVFEPPRRLFWDSSMETPDYIKQFYERYHSKYTEDIKQKFYSSYKKEENEIQIERPDFPKLPIDYQLEPEVNPVLEEFKHELELVTNQNQKEKIKVTFQPGKVNLLTEIPNPFDKEAREEFFRQFNFTMDYRSGYAPIAIQAQQEQEMNYKHHFIKKKQSCANTRLKRVCGVSYVKKLESEQLNVNHIFEKLPPLVFQGSSGCTLLDQYEDFVKQVYNNILDTCLSVPLVVTVLEAEDENLMREYLYYPERRFRLVKGKVWIIKSFDALWEFVKDRTFICIHLMYDDNFLIKKPELENITQEEIMKLLCKSNIQLGFLCRKSISGKKAFATSFFEEDFIEDVEENENSEEKTEENGKVRLLLDRKKRKLLKKKPESGANGENGENVPKKRGRKKKNIDGVKPTNKIPGLSRKQIHFFDKAKTKVEKDPLFKEGLMGQLMNDFQGIMEPYLKMLFTQNAPFPEFKKPETAANNSTTDEGKVIITTANIEAEKIQESNEVKEESNEKVENPPEEFNELDLELDFKIPEELEKECSIKSEDLIKQENGESQTTGLVEEKIENIEEIKQENNGEEPKIEESQKQEEKQEAPEKEEEKLNLPESIALLRKELKNDPKGNLYTMSMRIELYTAEDSWKSATSHTKNLLYTFIEYANQALVEKFRDWTNKRLDIFRNDDTASFNEVDPHVFLYEFDPSSSEEYLLQHDDWRMNNYNWNFSTEIKEISPINTENEYKLTNYKKNPTLAELQDNNRDTYSFSLPLYIITTRDSFAFDLIEKITYFDWNGHQVKKTEFFFDPNAYPSNFKSFMDKFPDFRVGVTTYHNFFTHEELTEIESKCYETERKFFSNHFLPMTGQMTCTSEKVRRTKFFFGARYIWTRQQLSEPHSMVGAGIRVDVSEPPKWTKELVEKKLVDAQIIPKDFINSIALNVYHDGKEGLAQHFDDAVRFRQPIFTVRLFSDSRLSFGSQFYGFCNGAFCIPMPRGCVTVLEEESYAANGIKHCVRPCDMTGKSAALILRQMHHKVYNEAKIYDEFVDFPTWFSTLSIKENAVSYTEQQRIEAEGILRGNAKKAEEKLPFHGGD